jgi:hypothetical protein
VTESAASKLSIGRLIFWPSLITLAITILRLEGELHNWGSPWFNRSAGGGAALIGISWLPIILGPYFALRLARAGAAPVSYGKSFGWTIVALVVLILGGVLVGVTERHPNLLTAAGFLMMLAAAFIPRMGWRPLCSTLLAYAFAARIPVLIVMYMAMSGNWGTHYDAVRGAYKDMALWRKFFDLGVLPQMFLWIGYTVAFGSLFGELAAALFHRRPPSETSSASTL